MTFSNPKEERPENARKKKWKSKTDPEERRKKHKEPRPPKQVTESSLEFDCMAYLQRFVASEKHLAFVLRRKVRRSALFHKQDPELFEPLIAKTVEKMVQAGLVDDAALAKGLVQSYHLSGKSLRFTREKLRIKGICNDDAEFALQEFTEKEENSELKAAVKCVQKKRLGPFRAHSVRKERFQRDLAALARAGFSYGIARQVLEAENEEALDLLLEEFSLRS